MTDGWTESFGLTEFIYAVGALASFLTVSYFAYKAWQFGIKGFSELIKLAIARLWWKFPKKTLIVLPQRQETIWWHMGEMGAKPVMQIVAQFHLTNITDEPVLVPKTFLIAYYQKWLIPLSTRVEGTVLVEGLHEQFGSYVIQPRETSEARCDWWILPPIKKERETLHGRACFVDKFGNEHWTSTLTWKYN